MGLSMPRTTEKHEDTTPFEFEALVHVSYFHISPTGKLAVDFP